MAHVVIVDDEPGFVSATADFLQLYDHTVSTANTLGSARDLLNSRIPDLLILDLMLPDGNGLELLDLFADRRPQKIVVITGHSGIKSLIGKMAGDGVSYLRKPIEPKDLLGIINTITAQDDASGAETGLANFGLLVGESDAMQKIYAQIRKVGPTDSTVLIQGESGTGKDLVANALHRESGRTGKFVPVNCGGLTQDLVSSQLFGHEKGSFTGANARHIGFFERANDGTLFLDEITEMPLEMQAHLLRVLETNKVLRLGAETEIDVNVRLIVATNRDPAKAITEGKLREDLYFRLRVFPLSLPALRDRGSDIPILAQYFLDELNNRNGTDTVLSDEAIRQLQAHSWPGNVRELKHTIHRAYILADNEITSVEESFEDDVPAKVEGLRVGRSIADVEKDLIIATLEHYRGDKKKAASSLGVSEKTLYNRLKAYSQDESAG